ncbi:MAG TPA: glycoside hydrolase family 9 protein, partial [Segetibacter sp.]|nr:glycoside hydrolase family 9 protein [Segetibacter sp.]
KKPGAYYLKSGNAASAFFRIANDVYAGTADFCLRYMRQQRSGFNPFLKDSCHTMDGYTVYGPMPDGTHIDVAGGWHDATDYLQYTTTSANATYHLLAAYRDFPGFFKDIHQSNGLEGTNGIVDVLDEAKWGLDWLMKMYPQKNLLFHQLADDRDHIGMRLPTRDSADYGWGKGKGRPVYFATGKPQGLGDYKNRSTGVASTAGKFASAFALASLIYDKKDPSLARVYQGKAESVYQLGLDKPGVCQTACKREPYFYEEGNWADDMELGSAVLYQKTGNKKYLAQSLQFASDEKVTPWMGADTARHYEWYPFHNFGHYELALKNKQPQKATVIDYYKQGIDRVWQKGKNNAFYRGVPFIWCSNNLTASFAIQCYLYRKLSGDKQYEQLEQSCFDWLFGCNPWGTSMVYALPGNRDTPADPHSSFTHLYHYPLDGGLVDGPLFGSIYRRMRGLKLHEPDEYEAFQSDYVVYHDDVGDYSTNEPTMDGTASLIYLLAEKENEVTFSPGNSEAFSQDHGAIIREPKTQKNIALVFTGDEFADGGDVIRKTLKQQSIPASFFLTGRFYMKPDFKNLIFGLKKDGHYLGPHSDQHLLFCDWSNRDSLLVTEQQFKEDLAANYKRMAAFGIKKKDASYFLPPFEWYNDTIAKWTTDKDIQLINYTPGTRSTADYTFPDMGDRYCSSDEVYNSIINYEAKDAAGLNGFILLAHIGTDPKRTDKFYNRLNGLLSELKGKGYHFLKINDLLKK